MLFVIIGVVLIGLNLAGIGPFGTWNWEFFGDLWKFCVPFVLAIVWWIWSDKSGLNKRREMQRMEEEEGRPAQGEPRRARHGHARAAARRKQRPSARPAAGAGAQSPSSTAPRLAVEAIFANLASTPRV